MSSQNPNVQQKRVATSTAQGASPTKKQQLHCFTKEVQQEKKIKMMEKNIEILQQKLLEEQKAHRLTKQELLQQVAQKQHQIEQLLQERSMQQKAHTLLWQQIQQQQQQIEEQTQRLLQAHQEQQEQDQQPLQAQQVCSSWVS
ncbi:ataxin-8-like [Anopheles ziemanni]|uniref:ataxin-8-like n=1 Tax=Anopheles coustani TaxID=139045 RepID=UPI002658F7BC|nr:ataxin-8-like [Anopheles coustani]XP_058169257.1 ataxin-8-like [Anopheles ziemanni]